MQGYRVVVQLLDDESDSDVALAQVEAMNAVQSGQAGGRRYRAPQQRQTLAAMTLYADMDLVVITPTASEQSLTEKGYTNFFRVNANDAVQAAVDARFLAEHLGARRIAVVHNNTEYGQGLVPRSPASSRGVARRSWSTLRWKRGRVTTLPRSSR